MKLIEPIQNNPLHFVETDMATDESKTITAEELGIEPGLTHLL